MGKSAFGTVFKFDNSEVAGLTSISGPGISGDTIDTSGHDNEDRYRTFVGGMVDGGEVTLEGNLTTADKANTLKTGLDSGDPKDCEIIFPNGTKWSFEGIVAGFDSDAPYDGKMGFSVTIKVSGKPEIEDAIE